MQTEIIPLCLRIMKRGQELSRTVATFIVQKILLDDNGLSYICQTGERFFAVTLKKKKELNNFNRFQLCFIIWLLIWLMPEKMIKDFWDILLDVT